MLSLHSEVEAKLLIVYYCIILHKSTEGITFILTLCIGKPNKTIRQ